MGVKLAYLELFDAADVERLEVAGIKTSDDLLARAAARDPRAALVARTGVAEATLMRLLRMSDLMRVAGINEPLTQLLDVMGVGTVDALARQDAAVLIKQMRRKNVEILVVRGMPPESTVARWIVDAKALPVVIGD